MSDHRRAAFCDGKVAFDTWSLADGVRRTRGRGDGGDRDRRQVYRCSFCHKFHLGVPSGKPRRLKSSP